MNGLDAKCNGGGEDGARAKVESIPSWLGTLVFLPVFAATLLVFVAVGVIITRTAAGGREPRQGASAAVSHPFALAARR